MKQKKNTFKEKRFKSRMKRRKKITLPLWNLIGEEGKARLFHIDPTESLFLLTQNIISNNLISLLFKYTFPQLFSRLFLFLNSFHFYTFFSFLSFSTLCQTLIVSALVSLSLQSRIQNGSVLFRADHSRELGR